MLPAFKTLQRPLRQVLGDVPNPLQVFLLRVCAYAIHGLPCQERAGVYVLRVYEYVSGAKHPGVLNGLGDNPLNARCRERFHPKIQAAAQVIADCARQRSVNRDAHAHVAVRFEARIGRGQIFDAVYR